MFADKIRDRRVKSRRIRKKHARLFLRGKIEPQ